jgi:hypothetical protein
MPQVYRILLGEHYAPGDCNAKGVLDLFILPLVSRKLITEFRAFRYDYFNNEDRRHHWSDEPLLCALYLGFAIGVGIELVRHVVAVCLTIIIAGADLPMGAVTGIAIGASIFRCFLGEVCMKNILNSVTYPLK